VDELPLSRAIRGESCEGIEVYARHATTGEGRLVSVTASPLRTSDGAVHGGVVVFRDVTLQQQTQEELRRSNAELEQFAYVASHDLQEPLRMVASYTQLLAKRYKGRLDADADEFIGFAVDGANRMQRLIQDLLAYSRVTTKQRELRLTSAEAALTRALANLRQAMAESGAVVTHDPLPDVVADETQLSQVFQNLVGNAIKYRGDAPPRVHVGVQRRDQEWVVSVRDNGIGIDPKYFERIFLLFQRLHGREHYEGTGIGLTIARKIIERHGGRIWVESQPGHGACFTFTLPARADAWRQTA
jgi:light-regulated signal transduction histidine kinase (bacteriophytochrome)